jgi:hypothetical protein
VSFVSWYFIAEGTTSASLSAILSDYDSGMIKCTFIYDKPSLELDIKVMWNVHSWWE